jgi:Tfp pilus assembly protein PilF
MKKSGVLHIQGSNKKLGRRLFFDQGQLVFANSNLQNDRLGIRLIRQGLLTEQQLQSAMLKVAQGERLGNVLVQGGYLSRKDLNYIVGLQVRDILFSTIELSDGLFFFEEIPLKLEEDLRLKIRLGHLLLNGIRGMRNHVLLFEEMGKWLDKRVHLGPSPLFPMAELPLNQKEAFLLGLLDRPTLCQDLPRMVDFPKDAVMRFLYASLALELVVPTEMAENQLLNRFSHATHQSNLIQSDPDNLDAELSEEQRQNIAQIMRQFTAIKTKNYWEFLDVHEHSSPEEIRSAYHRLLRIFHPDHFQSPVYAEYLLQINQVINHLNQTYNTLSNPMHRRKYESSLQQKIEQDEMSLREKHQIAKQMYLKGMGFVKVEDWFNAHSHLEKAVSWHPEMGRYWYALAKVELQNQMWLSRATEHLKKAVKLDNKLHEAHFELAKLMMAQDQEQEAKWHLRKVLELVPLQADAQTLLDSFQEKEKKSVFEFLRKK